MNVEEEEGVSTKPRRVTMVRQEVADPIAIITNTFTLSDVENVKQLVICTVRIQTIRRR